MQLTFNVDDETYAALQSLAQAENCNLDSALARALRMLPRRLFANKPASAPKAAHGYTIPVSQGSRPFTMEDVRRAEEEDDLRHLMNS